MRIITLTLFAVVGAPSAASADATTDAARAVLARHCAGCHGGPDHGPRADRGGFDRLFDRAALVDDELVTPGDPDGSELYRRIADGEMPPRAVTRRPSPAELAAVRAWIASGAPAFDDADGEAGLPIDRLVAADLARRGGAAATSRYVSLAHLPAGERSRAAHAVGKLLNSLSWRRRIWRPQRVDGDRLLRIDLRWYGWDADRWERLARSSPQLAVWRSAEAADARRRSRSLAPVVPGDWLVWAASRPPLYHQLLELPTELAALERQLAPAADPVRSGFNGSGVSRHNRLIERRSLTGSGYLWISFDFAAADGRRNLFQHPIDFDHDGGEVIFSLPNGLQGYLLVDADGRRIDSAPTGIVVDPRRPDSAVQNGVSCFGCHAEGIIPKRDQLRDHVVANGRAFGRRRPDVAGRVLALHPPAAELDRIVRRDRERFARAMAALGPAPAVESIDATARAYEREVDLIRAAAELGAAPAELARAIGEQSGELARVLGALRVGGGTVEREVWDARLPALIAALGGRPLSSVSDDLRRALPCGGRSSAATCYAVADRFFRGRGVAVDRRLAFRLYGEACRRGSGRGCTAEGLLALTGRGTEPSATLARRRFDRACRLGDARGCERLGRLRLAADGGPRDARGARAAMAAACRGDRPRACATLGGLRYHAIGGDRDFAAAFAAYRRACAGGVARACRDAGHLVEHGLGVGRSRLAAARWYARACDAGDVGGCLRAGDAAYRGRGVRRDQTLAARYFDRGCRAGGGEACRRLAVQYRWGKGVRIDWIRSERLFRRACRLGVKRACAYL